MYGCSIITCKERENMNAVEFNATVTDGKISIPRKYIPRFSKPRKVKVILIEKESSNGKKADVNNNDSLGFGILSSFANPDLIPMESKAWERAAIKKHEAN